MNQPIIRLSISDSVPVTSNINVESSNSHNSISSGARAAYVPNKPTVSLATVAGNRPMSQGGPFMGPSSSAGSPRVVGPRPLASPQKKTIVVARGNASSLSGQSVTIVTSLQQGQEPQTISTPAMMEIPSTSGNFLPRGMSIAPGGMHSVASFPTHPQQQHQIQRPTIQNPSIQSSSAHPTRFVTTITPGLQQPSHQLHQLHGPVATHGSQLRPQQIVTYGGPGPHMMMTSNPRPTIQSNSQAGVLPPQPVKPKSKKKKAPANPGAQNSNRNPGSQSILPQPGQSQHDCQAGISNSVQTASTGDLPPKPKKKKSSSSGKKLSATALKAKAENERYARKHYLLKRCVKALVFKNGALCDEVARLKQRILTVSKEREILVKRLFHHERLKQRKKVNAEKRALAAAVAAANANRLEVTVTGS